MCKRAFKPNKWIVLAGNKLETHRYGSTLDEQILNLCPPERILLLQGLYFLETTTAHGFVSDFHGFFAIFYILAVNKTI